MCIQARRDVVKPKLFIGSDAESLEVARAIQIELDYDAEVTLWTQGILRLTKSTLGSLLSHLNIAEFGVFVFSPSDVVEIRGERQSAIRDNVLFELGLFMGRLGREKTFFILPRSASNIRLPTDLLGITPATFDDERKDVQASVGAACSAIRIAIRQARPNLALSQVFERIVGGIGYLKTAPNIYEHALKLYKTAKQKVRVLQSYPGPRPPRDYAERAAAMLLEKKNQNIDVLFDAYIAFDFENPPDNFEESNEARLRVYEEKGVRDRVSLQVLNLFFPIVDMFIVDRTHAHVSFTTSDRLPNLQRGIAFVESPEVVGDLVEWFEHTVVQNSISYDEYCAKRR